MNKFFSMIYAVYFFVLAIIFLPVIVVLSAISPLIDKRKRLQNALTGKYMFHMLTISPGWTFTYQGLENLKAGGPYVLVANHQSLADIVALYGMNYPLRWVAKDDLFAVPFLGWIMWLDGHIRLSRGDMHSARLMLARSAAWLTQGISVVMFAEGTRSADGQVAPFRPGAFWLAKHANVPIIPIAIDGTHEMLPKSAKQLNFRADVLVRIMPPVSAAKFGGDTEMFKNYVHTQIANALIDMRHGKQPVEAPRAA
jgi:1-acyl-sn-glycerol-3-phosphate acyltransferase